MEPEVVDINRPMKRPTISDVARHSGVSKTTVSVILNASPAGVRLSAETRGRVMRAATELGYRPSWRGRALTSRRTHTVGILYAPPMPLILRGNYAGIVAGINEGLARRGYHMMFVPLGEDRSRWADVLADQRLDGCLVLSRLYDVLGTLLEQNRMPAALVNADTDLPLPVVLPDDYDGAQQLMNHLLGLGHRRVTFFLGDWPPHYSVGQRTAAYQTLMGRAGFDAHVRIVRGTVEAFAADLVGTPAAQRPTAVITYTHYAAVTMLRLLWEAGLSVPRDLSVATFSDSYPVAEVIPPLTAVALPTEEMGRVAADLILELIEADTPVAPRRAVLKESLIVRRSTAAPPGGDAC